MKMDDNWGYPYFKALPYIFEVEAVCVCYKYYSVSSMPDVLTIHSDTLW